MRAVFDIFLRDLMARLRDRSAIVVGLLAPLGLTIVLSLLIGGPTIENRPIGYVPDTSASAVDQALRLGAFAQLTSEKVIVVRDYPDRAAAAKAVDDGDVDAAIVVETSGDRSKIDVLHSPDASIGGSIADSIAGAAAAQINGVVVLLVAQRALGTPAGGDAATAGRQAALELAGSPPAAELRDGTESAGGISARTQIASGMATFFLFFTVQFGLLGILQERRQGTLARLLAAPIRPAHVLIAKLLVSFVLGVLSMGALVVVSELILDARFGSPVGVALLVIAGVAAATATIALVTAIANTPEQAGIAQSMVALVLGILGGSFFSMARSGGIGALASKLTPHYWFNEGLVRMSSGGCWTSVLVPVALLAVFAAVVGLPGAVLAKRAVRP